MSSERSFSLIDVGPKINSILKKTVPSKPVAPATQGSKFGPIALCARSEESPNKRASKDLGSRPSLNVVFSKDFSPASMAMNATKEYTRLDSMKPP